MSYKKNTASQKFNVLAINTATSLPVTGDAANITAKISIDSAAFASVTDTNPTELDATNAPGVYVFDLSQSETNGDVLTIVPSSSTANVQMDILNIYTVVLNDYKADVSALATSSALATVDTVVDAILVDTGTTIPAQITGLNNLDAAGVRSAIGLASANLDTQIADLPTVAEFEARTLVAASYFDPAADTVANVTLVGTTTNNTDMVGTDNAALATSLSITNSSVNTIKTVTNALPDSGALTSLATASDLATVDTVVDAILVDTGTTIPSQITALNNLDAAGVRSAVGLASADLDTQLGDIPTVSEFEARTLVASAYFDSTTDTVTVGTNNDKTGYTLVATPPTSAEIYTYFTDGTREDLFKADVSGLALASSLSITNSNVNSIKAKTDQFVFTVPNQVDSNALTGGGGDDAATIYTYFTSGTNENAFKADVSSLATSSALATVDLNVDAILVDTSSTIPLSIGVTDGKVSSILTDTNTTIPSQISGLNDFNPSTDTVANVSNVALVATTTTNTDMRGTDGANTTTPPSVSSIVSGISSETYDGVAFEDVMKVLLSMAQGKIVESSSGVFEFYAQDDATVLYTLTKSGSQRNRS